MTLTRRQLLRTALFGAGAVALAPLAGCGGPVRDDVDESAPPHGPLPHLDTLPSDLLRWASLAPSSRNTQPWTVRVAGPARLVLGIDPRRRLTALDPDETEALIALGAFVENFVLAAAVRGWHTDVTLVGEGAPLASIVDLRWHPGTLSDYPMERLDGRQTLREGFATRPLRPEHAARLEALLEGHVALIDPPSSTGKLVADAVVEGSRAQFARRAARMEVASWLRWRDDDVRRMRDGLTAESMEFEGFENWWVRNVYTRASALTPGYARHAVDRVRRRASECGAWIVVTGEADTVAARLECGRRFERMALELREQGLAAHPMTAVLEEPVTHGAFVRALGLGETPRLLLRVGYVDKQGDPVSLRRPVSWFVTA